MTHPLHFDDSNSVDIFGFDENGDQYRFDNFHTARSWVDEDPENRAAMQRQTKVTYKTYQHLYCGTCGKVSAIENEERRICLNCMKKKLEAGI